MESAFPRRPRAVILTLGCRVNQYESDAIAGELEADGFDIVPAGAEAEITVVNTCTVTGESDRKSRQHIRRAAAANPAAPLIVTGCFAEVFRAEAAAIPGVTAVVGNGEKGSIPALARTLIDGSRRAAPVAGERLTLRTPRRVRSFIKIEDGCENRCAYCIIPAARGPVRSRPPQEIVDEVRGIAAAGCQEIILTGIETGAYGRDSGGAFSLGSLLLQLSEVPGVRRLTLGSLDPSLLRTDFLDAAAAVPALMPHFHLSLQSGSSSVLRRMRRPYNASQALDCVARIRRTFPDVMLTADVITGFPGETEEEFEETLVFCREAQFLHMHIFPFSARRGTEAASMPAQGPVPIRRARAARLEAEGLRIRRALLDGYVAAHREAPVSVLIEEEEDGELNGHSEHYVEIHMPRDTGAPGDIVPIRLTETDGRICRGVRSEPDPDSVPIADTP